MTVLQADTICHDAFQIDQFVKELVKDVKVSGDEPFFGDLTYDEYFAMPDVEREALWTKEYRQELDKTESEPKEKEIYLDAIPAGQGRNAEIRRRIREQRKRHTLD